MANPTTAGGRIRAALRARGMSVADLAQRLGYLRSDGTPTTYTYNLLSGHQRFSRGQLERIAEVLGLDGDDLCFDEGHVPADIEERLRGDRAFLRVVRDVMRNGSQVDGADPLTAKETP